MPSAVGAQEAGCAWKTYLQVQVADEAGDAEAHEQQVGQGEGVDGVGELLNLAEAWLDGLGGRPVPAEDRPSLATAPTSSAALPPTSGHQEREKVSLPAPCFSKHGSSSTIWCACLPAQPCLTLCDPLDCSPPSSAVHGILQARILEQAAMPSSRESSPPGIEPRSPALQLDSLLSEPQVLWDDNEKHATLKKALTHPRWHPDLGLPASRTIRNKFPPILSYLVCYFVIPV